MKLSSLRCVLSVLAIGPLAALGLYSVAAAQKPGSSTSRIAFTDWASGGGFRQVFLINPDGSGKAQITNETSKQHDFPTWSPDKAKIAVGIPGTLKIIDVATGSSIQFANPGHEGAGWSARTDASTSAFLPWNQQQLVYNFWNSTGYFSNVSVRKPDGTGTPIQLTACGYSLDGLTMTSATNATWLPDAAGSATTRIVYMLRTSLVDISGTYPTLSLEPRLISLDASAWPSISVISDQPLATVNSLPSGVNTPSRLTFDRQTSQVLWARTGNIGFWIANVNSDSNGDPVIDLATARTLASSGWQASFNPDGSQISFLNRPGTTYTNIYRINTNNTGLATVYNKSRLGTGVSTANWGP